MRIAVLTSLFPSRERPREGIFAERRWALMRARGHEVRVVQPLPWTPLALGRTEWRELAAMPAQEIRSGVDVTRPRYLHIPRLARSNARRFARAGLRAILAGERPDVVVLDYAWPASAASEGLARERIPCVVNGRGSDVLAVAGEAGLGAELARNLRAAGHWCAVSEDLVRRMDELAGEPRGVLVPNGVDGEVFRPRERAECRRELHLEQEGSLALVVGHLIDRKDPLLALDAFAEAARTLPNARMAFVGRGPLHEALLARARELRLESRVQLVGEATPESLALWYGAADLLLLTSRREGRPNVVLEALSSGLPVLATDAGGTRELLRGLPGALLDTRDADAIAARIVETLRTKADRELLRAHARSFGWESGLDALESLLATAMGAAR